MSVDVATGLPVLPEGLFWRVDYAPAAEVEDEHILRWDRSYWCVPKDSSRLAVLLMRSTTYERKYREGRLWWATTRTDPYTRDSLIALQRCDGVEPEDVLRAAEELLRFRQEAADHASKVNLLVGDYPPKTLEVA